MSKHTAGPWDVETSIKAFIPKSQGGGEKIRIMAGSGETRRRICSLNVENLSQAKIDARLIVAAPELLEAVKDALSAYQENAEKTGKHYDNRAGTIGLEGVLIRAIAKAEGRHV